MKSKIETEERVVLDSGFIIMDKSDSKVSISVSDGTSGYGKICFEFINGGDGVSEEASLEASMRDGIPVLKCYNFNNRLGSGTIDPLELNLSSGKILFVYFWIYLVE